MLLVFAEFSNAQTRHLEEKKRKETNEDRTLKTNSNDDPLTAVLLRCFSKPLNLLIFRKHICRHFWKQPEH